MISKLVEPEELLRLFKSSIQIDPLIEMKAQGWAPDRVDRMAGETNWTISQIESAPIGVRDKLRKIEKDLSSWCNVIWR